jgi:hypothetical protein
MLPLQVVLLIDTDGIDPKNQLLIFPPDSLKYFEKVERDTEISIVQLYEGSLGTITITPSSSG